MFEISAGNFVQKQVAKTDAVDEIARNTDKHDVLEKCLQSPDSLADERVSHARNLHNAIDILSVCKSALHFFADFCK